MFSSVLDVSAVCFVCVFQMYVSIVFIWMLNMLYTYVACVLFRCLCIVAMVFKCVSGCFSIILEVCFKCFNCQMYVATVVLKCFKSSLDIASLSSHLLLHHTVGSRGTGVW